MKGLPERVYRADWIGNHYCEGVNIWSGPSTEYIRKDIAASASAALKAQVAAADALAALVNPLMDGTIEIDDAPLHVGGWYTDLAAALAAYRAAREATQ